MDIDLGAIARSVVQVLGVGLLFGAGLPALFALGMRSLAAVPPGRPLDPGNPLETDRPSTPGSGDATAAAARDQRATTAGRVGAAICFGLCVVVAVFGVVVIVFGKQLFGE